MGVPGLWDLLRPAAARTSLSTLSRDAFYANKNGLRALTIGVDASIWIFHAQLPQYGDNPFLRTIFYKITALLQHPVLPVFVFDGPNKPSQKRNQNVAGQFGTADHRSKQFKALLNVCGLEWWNAPGEAEAELAVMNRQGKIDAVLSDDVDALLFGATCLLRNNSPTLSGAQASSTQANLSRGDARQYEVYRSEAIKALWTAKEGTALATEEDCRMAMVWIALLGGGDYVPEGLFSIGPTISFGLANAGLSDFLKQYTTDRHVFNSSIDGVHSRMIEELRTNASKNIGRRYPDRAGKLASVSPASLFPESSLEAYLEPCTSPSHESSLGWPGFGQGESTSQRGKARNHGRGDMEGFAKACEDYFEWGTKDLVAKKFASEAVGVFGAQLVDEAREAIRQREKLTEPSLVHQNVGTSQAATASRITSFFQNAVPHFSSSPKSSQISSQPASIPQAPAHVLRIHSVRRDPTNPDLKEYRIAYKHAHYIQRCHDAMAGTRVNPKDLSLGEKQKLGLVEREDDTEAAPEQQTTKSEIRVWMAEYLVREAWPALVKDYENDLAAKLSKTPKKKASNTAGKGRSKGTKNKSAARGEDVNAFEAFFTQGPRSSRSQSQTTAESDDIGQDRSECQPLVQRSVNELSMSSPPASPRSPRRSPSMPNLQGKKMRSRPCPTSSLSSLPESATGTLSTPPRSPTSSRISPLPSPTPRARPRAKSRRTSHTPSPPRPTAIKLSRDADQTKAPRFANRQFTKSKSSPSTFHFPIRKNGSHPNQPIDLCSSNSDETNAQKIVPTTARKATHRVPSASPPFPSTVLASSSRPNTLSPPSLSPPKSKPSLSRPKLAGMAAKSRANTYAQPRPMLPVITGSPASSQAAAKATSKQSPKKRRPKYTVVSSNDEEEMIDCTR